MNFRRRRVVVRAIAKSCLASVIQTIEIGELAISAAVAERSPG
jgi:hypothetical protein